jgi:phosphoribosylformylglycinamidine synthase
LGEINEIANPNGAVRNIAGIRNHNNNVYGMMPHPERATSSLLNNIDGKKVFEILNIN